MRDRQSAWRIGAVLAGLAVRTAANSADWIGAPKDVLEQQDIERLLKQHPLAAGENIRAVRNGVRLHFFTLT